MDAVELGRQLAARMHDDAVAKGKDPLKPYLFAVAEADRLGWAVEKATPGAAMLKGGRAVLEPEAGLVLHEDAGSEFEQAFLVAHELGHAVLGDGATPVPALAVDPARPAEASPIGTDRVVDYSRRQRREVQMDLFAREFLLPRKAVRDLHVSRQLDASAIAKRFGAPFEVVAQQLFDALLLPEIKLVDEMPRPEPEANNLQKEAAAHRGCAYLLIAGPGTGKTQTLTLRVNGLVAEGVDPRRILLLTFSNKAAGEMAERIARRSKEAAAAMSIGTFHAFGLDLIRRFFGELGFSTEPRLLDRVEAVEILEEEFPRLELRHYQDLYDPASIIAEMLTTISRAKDEVVDAPRFMELADAMLAKAAAAEDRDEAERAQEIGRVYLEYERFKREANCVDFGDLVLLPVLLLEQHPEIRDHVQGLFDHILVDEYQDVNHSSVRLLQMLKPSGNHLWAVGDPKQSIYRFRGASSFNVTRFGVQDFPGGITRRLERNYRSYEEIINAYSAFATDMGGDAVGAKLEADRGKSNHLPQVRTVGMPEQQAPAVSDAIREMRAAGYAFRDQAVLCAGNDKLADIGEELERLNIPILFLGSLFERTEIRQLLSFLSLLVDRRAMGLLALANLPEFALSLDDVGTALRHLRTANSEAVKWLEAAKSIAGLSEPGIAVLERLGDILRDTAPESSPWDVLAEMLLDRTRILAKLSSSGTVADQARGIAIWQFMNFIRVQPRGKGAPVPRLLNRIRRLVRLSDERDLRHLPAAAQGIDAVRLMTMHGAKGLEFPVVHLPALTKDSLPRAMQKPKCLPPNGMIVGGVGAAWQVLQAGHGEEQKCLFYVALSRAKDRLFLYAPTQKANGHSREVSPFLGRLGSGVVCNLVSPSQLLPTSPYAGRVKLEIEGGLRFNGSQLDLYESCPRRFFYTHVLQVGGRRIATPFVQMHDAVRQVFKAMIDAQEHDVSEADLVERTNQALTAAGLSTHGYLAQYRAFALNLLQYFLSTRRGITAEKPAALSLNFGGEKIVVNPDEILVKAGGERVYRRIHTGKKRSNSKDLGAAVLLLAARQSFPGATVELVYLSDQDAAQYTQSTKQLQNRRTDVTEQLRLIREGAFPIKSSIRVCPNCPAFFICGPTPPGTLKVAS